MKSSDLKEIAHKRYLATGNVPELLIIIKGLKKSTLYNWIKKEKWDKERKKRILNLQSSPDILSDQLNTILQQTGRVLNEMKTSDDSKKSEEQIGLMAKLYDSLSKVSKIIKTHYKDFDRLSSALFVMGELASYMNTNKKEYNEDFREKFDKLLEGFQELMITKYSPKNQL